MNSQDDWGDETELEIIIEAGQREAEEFSGPHWPTMSSRPAKWLNPPRPVRTTTVERLANVDRENSEHNYGQG